MTLIHSLRKDENHIYKNIILIDSQVSNYKLLFDSLNDDTFGIVYSYDISINTIQILIQNNFQNLDTCLNRVAICCHEDETRFLENKTFFSLNNESIKNENSQFIIDLLVKYKVVNIDFLACSSLKYYYWKSFYDLIENEVGSVTVGASEDKTGNLRYGGNWVMENTREKVDTIYFNEGISYYKHLLSTIERNIEYIRVENNTYIHFVELIAYQGSENITHGKPVTSSTIHGNHSKDKIVDGTLFSGWLNQPENYFHTKNINPYVEINLSGSFNINKIEIYLIYQLPTDMQERYNNLKIKLKKTDNDSTPTEINFPIYGSDDFNRNSEIYQDSDNNWIHKLTIFEIQPHINSFNIPTNKFNYIDTSGVVTINFSDDITGFDLSINDFIFNSTNIQLISLTNVSNIVEEVVFDVITNIYQEETVYISYNSVDYSFNINVNTLIPDVSNITINQNDFTYLDTSGTLMFEFTNHF